MIADARGAVGGVVFSRNRGGLYTRSRVVPINPGSSFQQDVRTLLAFLTNAWFNDLSDTERSSWDAYAESVELVNPLGDLRKVTGLNHYVRSNLPRLQAGEASLARVDTAPTTQNLGSFYPPEFSSVDPTPPAVDVTFASDDWSTATGGAMLVYASRGKNASINYFKGPYQYAGAILGNTATPPTSPETISLPFPYQLGDRVFFQVRVTRPDGRLTTPFRDYSVCAI
jgi:hypothetical protein